MRNRRAFIGLGGNVGDRLGFLRRAARGIRALPESRLRAVSAVYETSPIGPRQRNFLNAAAEIRTSLAPGRLLKELKGVERRLGRRSRRRWGPREIDLDLLFHGRRRMNAGGLRLPHPRLRERKFVLRPLADLAPRFLDPATGKTVARLLAELTDPSQKVRLYRRNWLGF